MVPLEALCSSMLIPLLLMTAGHGPQRARTGAGHICVLSSHGTCRSDQELLRALKKTPKIILVQLQHC